MVRRTLWLVYFPMIPALLHERFMISPKRFLPIGMLTRLGLANFITPRTSDWSGARDAMNEYIAEREEHHRKALKLDELVQMAETELN